MTPHETTIRLARQANDDLGALFVLMGGTANPNGAIVRAYRVALRALQGGADPAEVLAELRQSLLATIAALLDRAAALGEMLGTAQLAAYGLRPSDAAMPESAQRAWVADVDAQFAAVRGLLALGAALVLIIGDVGHAGVLTPGPILVSGARWLAEATQGAYRGTLMELDGGWQHQAVAALDSRTTECCRRVHGQVQPLARSFQLSGTPRYADALPHPPFHRFCRTAEALVSTEDANDALTQQMRADAAHGQGGQGG